MPRYEPTYSLGTILTIASLVISLGSIWIRVETLLAKHEVRIENLERSAGIRSAHKPYESSRQPGS